MVEATGGGGTLHPAPGPTWCQTPSSDRSHEKEKTLGLGSLVLLRGLRIPRHALFQCLLPVSNVFP